jgi:predicted ArsR family transcriptional regulator
MERDLQALSVLVEPQRLRVYEHLRALAGPASLTEMAAALDMGRTLLTFHLGKLVEEGFVEVLAPDVSDGRRGRPSQRYRVTDREVSASVPPRRYELVAEVLLEAAAEGSEPADVARRRGIALADEQGVRRRGRPAPLTLVESLLRKLGYAPRRAGNEVVLASCPFDRLRATNLDLVCGINAGLAQGYLEGLGLADAVTSRLRPCPDSCCVVFSPA